MGKILRIPKIKYSSNNGYSYVPNKIITVKSYESTYSNVHTFYDKIKDKFKKSKGRYKIKIQELKYIGGWRKMAYKKKYFCYADSGICTTSNKKSKLIFHTNNTNIAIRLAKHLAQNMGDDCLISLVDIKNDGKETYFITKNQRLGMWDFVIKM